MQFRDLHFNIACFVPERHVWHYNLAFNTSDIHNLGLFVKLNHEFAGSNKWSTDSDCVLSVRVKKNSVTGHYSRALAPHLPWDGHALSHADTVMSYKVKIQCWIINFSQDIITDALQKLILYVTYFLQTFLPVTQKNFCFFLPAVLTFSFPTVSNSHCYAG